jgi:hypothetical protein
LVASCTEIADNDSTNTIVTILSIEGSGGEPLNSDVCVLTETGGCTVFNDNATVIMIARPKDQGLLSLPPGQFNDVVFERYRVTYIRADGRNTPGVEVPYPFDGASTFTVPITGDQITRSIMVVRHQAKREPPLANIAFGGGARILSVIAEIEFFGRDVGGRAITVKGLLGINFADFADD